MKRLKAFIAFIKRGPYGSQPVKLDPHYEALRGD